MDIYICASGDWGGEGRYKLWWVRSFSSFNTNSPIMEGVPGASGVGKRNCKDRKHRKKKQRKYYRAKSEKGANHKCFGCLSKSCTKKSDRQDNLCGELEIII